MFRAPQARILIVDDTEMNLMVMRGILKATELQVTTASSGKEAIALAAQSDFDLILMDQRMPEMDGTETQKRIRMQADGKNRDLPIICLTADAIQGARERYLEQGFTDYLSKPVESAALEEMLMRYLPANKVTRMEVSGAKMSTDREIMEVQKDDPGIGEPIINQALTKEEAVRLEEELTPKLLMSYRALRELLEPFFAEPEKEQDLPEMSVGELQELYDGIMEFAGIYAQDDILRLLGQAEAYRIPEEEQARMKQIRKCVKSSDWSALKDVMNGQGLSVK